MRSYERGRTCGHSACDTILSIYNPSKYCWAHEEVAAGRHAQCTPRLTREVTLEAIRAERLRRAAQARPASDQPGDEAGSAESVA